MVLILLAWPFSTRLDSINNGLTNYKIVNVSTSALLLPIVWSICMECCSVFHMVFLSVSISILYNKCWPRIYMKHIYINLIQQTKLQIYLTRCNRFYCLPHIVGQRSFLAPQHKAAWAQAQLLLFERFIMIQMHYCYYYILFFTKLNLFGNFCIFIGRYGMFQRI